MNPRSRASSDGLLLLAAAIWGFAFVAQRAGMEHLGPFTFNGVRFGLGSLVLLPFVWFRRSRQSTRESETTEKGPPDGHGAGRGRLSRRPPVLFGGLIAGLVLFAGASLQQTGIVYTTAGKAGFITGLYVILVPILGLLWRQRPGINAWIGAILAVVGLFFLSVSRSLSIALGDTLVLASALFWALHVLIIGRLSPGYRPSTLAFLQYATCCVLSLSVAFFTETISRHGLIGAALPLLYAGLLSTAVAYTLQVVAQRHSPPVHAAIILSLEAVFAALGGWIMLGETLTPRGLFGCALMLVGMLTCQLGNRAGFNKLESTGEAG